jgi:hypothetical protein
VKRNVLIGSTLDLNRGANGIWMAPQYVLLLTFWLLATAVSVTYVTLRPQPPGRSVSPYQQDDVPGLRDRPLDSWGPYLPRIVSKEARTAVAKAPSLGREPPTITKHQQQPVVQLPKVERTIPHTSEPSAAAEAASQKRAQEALFGAENEQLALKSIPSEGWKSKPTAKLPSARKKAITEGRKRRFARRGGDRGLGLFALGDFGRRQGY